MKISICIPHYNRINYLLKSLEIINNQKYDDYEVIISDDCSTDDTFLLLNEHKNRYKFPVVYFRFEENQGYDRNLRKSMELATGQYCFVLGNDDTFAHDQVLNDLEKFLITNHFPDIGFCNYCEFQDPKIFASRAFQTGVVGSGVDTAILYYSSFSFVGGIILKKSVFDMNNTSIYDKSIFAQIALALHIISNGGVLFSIQEVWVKKDITVDNDIKSNSYRDFINRSWRKISPADGGLKSVVNVLVRVLKANSALTISRLNFIFKKILLNTYPYWVLDYKFNKATPAAIGLFLGLKPWTFDEFYLLPVFKRLKFIIAFYFVSVVAFLFPSHLFFIFKERIYAWLKKK
jgi:glycosyltransferase involved in cell wall biosynthesis